MDHDYDVVIIGGGMVGASLALLLPEQLKVLVVESFAIPNDLSPENYQPSFDARATALSHGSRQILEGAGLWQSIEQHAQPISDIHVSDRGHWGSTWMNHAQEHWQALGYVVENAWLGRSLMQMLQQKSHVALHCPATVTGISVTANGARITVESGNEQAQVCARLAVIADGATSKSCRMLGIDHNVNDYGHTAIIANVSTTEPHNGIAYERFTDSGPLALLPLVDTADHKNRSALIWTLPNDQAEALLALDDDTFSQQLQKRFGNWQGHFNYIGKRSSYPLKLSTACEQVRQHIVVLGNAAHSLHPVAGQGFNLALRDVRKLVDLINNALDSGQSIGELSVLKHYQAQQEKDQYLTTLFSDVLPGIFTSHALPVQAGRNLGLLSLELLPPLKSRLVRFAAGIRYN